MQQTDQDFQENNVNFLASIIRTNLQNGYTAKPGGTLLARDRANVITSFNKSDSQSSLYQRCFSLRDKLLKMRRFTEHFPELTSSSDSTDPVTQLWDLFSMGAPLCYIFDQLPPEDGFKKLENYSLRERNHEPNLDRAKKHAIALFVMQLRNLVRKIPECEMFTVTDLWNRHSTDGLVKVVNTVTAVVNYLPQDVFNDDQVAAAPVTDTNTPQDNIVREMLETERKYVQDLETMQRFANVLSQSNVIDQDTIHLLFPNLNQLVNFQRKFLIQLEFTAQQPSKVQRWGQQFIEYEEEFSVYEPYCVNYKNATELMLRNEKTLAALNHMVDVKSELPALLLKPIKRVCQYPIFLDVLKALSHQGYGHHDELIHGSEAAKRVVDKINEAQRWDENQKLVQNLMNRVQDWRGHHPANFGDLLLHDIFMVNKADVDRLYAIYLFQKVLIFIKVGDNHRSWSKQKTPATDILAMFSPTASTPLVLKGRIFMGNVMSATELSTRTNTKSDHFPLLLTWEADDGTDTATIKFTRQEQMKQWQKRISLIIQSYKSKPVPLQLGLRRFGSPPLNSRYSTVSNLTLPWSSLQKEGDHDDCEGDLEREKQPDDQELSSDSDNGLEDYPAPSYPPSGRDTPVENRFLTRSRSLPSRAHFGLDKLFTSKDDRTHLRARSHSLPASIPTFSYATSKQSDNGHTPPKTPQVSNRSLPPIAEDLFQSPPRFETPESTSVKLKVHFKDDILVILVSRTIIHDDLIERIKRKCRLCGPLPDGPFKVKYRDEDGDLISLTSTEDVQLAFEHLEPGKSVYFYVS